MFLLLFLFPFFFFFLCWELALGKTNVQKVLMHRTISAHYNFMVCHYKNVSQSSNKHFATFTIQCFTWRTCISSNFYMFLRDKSIRDKQKQQQQITKFLVEYPKKEKNLKHVCFKTSRWTIKAVFVSNCLLQFLCLMKTL